MWCGPIFAQFSSEDEKTDQLDAAAPAQIAWQAFLPALEQSVRSEFANAVSTLLTGRAQRNQPISRNAIWFQLLAFNENLDPTLIWVALKRSRIISTRQSLGIQLCRWCDVTSDCHCTQFL